MLVFFIFELNKKLNKHWYPWCPHTDSNREPTDYKSTVLGISSLICVGF